MAGEFYGKKGDVPRYKIEAKSLTEAFKKAVKMGIVKNRKIRGYSGSLSEWDAHVQNEELVIPRPPLELDLSMVIWETSSGIPDDDFYRLPIVLMILRKGSEFFCWRCKGLKILDSSGPMAQYDAFKRAKEFCEFYKIEFHCWNAKKVTRK